MSVHVYSKILILILFLGDTKPRLPGHGGNYLYSITYNIMRLLLNTILRNIVEILSAEKYISVTIASCLKCIYFFHRNLVVLRIIILLIFIIPVLQRGRPRGLFKYQRNAERGYNQRILTSAR